MTTAEMVEHPGYEAIAPWHHRQPFADGEQYPTVITRADAPYSSWAPVRQPDVPSARRTTRTYSKFLTTATISYGLAADAT